MKEYKIIKKMFEKDDNRNIFCKHIDYIRFPYFKNYVENLKVTFDLPITFLTGTNGSGKSSLLHAMYATVKNNSISDFWFNTAVDPIKDLEDNRHCFIYGFTTEYSKRKIETIKTRIKRNVTDTKKIDPDYWEPSRPIVKYGMDNKIPHDVDPREASKTRWNLVEREVYYMDFRYLMSAYDKYFYFGSKPNSKTIKSKQEFVRARANKLKKAFEDDATVSYYSRTIKKPISFSKRAIKEISYILGKNYFEAKLLSHNLYAVDKSGDMSFAIKYKTDNQSYSEAYAGSGEVAVAKLVKDFLDLQDYTLVLLDEPETSLHPSAQIRLINFILRQIKDKKLQVVISTHSPDILTDAPKESICVLHYNSNIEKVEVNNKVHRDNAFVNIGRPIDNKKMIIVEDKLAKMIVESVIKENNDEEIFQVVYHPGGESSIKKEDMVVYSREEESNVFIILDGDQKKEKYDLTKLKNCENNSRDLLDIIKKIVNCEVKFPLDSNSENLDMKEKQKVEAMKKYIDFHSKKVFFLPQKRPEDIICNEKALNQIDFKKEFIEKLDKEINSKDKAYKISKELFGDVDNNSYESTLKFLIKNWLEHEDSEYKIILNIIKEIKDK